MITFRHVRHLQTYSRSSNIFFVGKHNLSALQFSPRNPISFLQPKSAVCIHRSIEDYLNPNTATSLKFGVSLNFSYNLKLKNKAPLVTETMGGLYPMFTNLY